MVKRLVTGVLGLLFATAMWMNASAAEEPGQRLYQERCSQCHGAEGRGGKGPRLVPFDWSYETALELIRRPLCDMPPIPESVLSDAEVAQIVEYLKTIK
jgi:mono/diheme cytochrome c family protein